MKVKSSGRSLLLVLLVTIVGSLLITACGASTGLGDRVAVTYGIFDQLPLTDSDARAKGWTELKEVVVNLDLPESGCVPNHGRHFIKSPNNLDTPETITFAGEPIDPITLLMNAPGDLIGIELSSVDEQVVPPWEFSPKGHPDMDYRHWHMHVYFSDPAQAC